MRNVPQDLGIRGVDEEGIAFREIAEVIGRRLNLPIVAKAFEEAVDHFGWIDHFTQLDGPVSSKVTQQRQGWRPAALRPYTLSTLNSLEYCDASAEQVQHLVSPAAQLRRYL